MTGASSAVAEAPLSEIGFAGALPKGAFTAGLGAALPPLMARSTGWSSIDFATAAFPAALADLLALGISHPLIEVPHLKSTMFWQLAIRLAGQHFIYRFRELRAEHATFCTPVTGASPNGGLLSTGPR